MARKPTIPLRKTVYLAIRKSTDDGHEWMDTSTISVLVHQAGDIARRHDREVPQWAVCNPVVRLVRATLSTEE